MALRAGEIERAYDWRLFASVVNTMTSKRSQSATRSCNMATGTGTATATATGTAMVTAIDVWGQHSTLLMPDCHPAIFAKGAAFRNEATADERATAVMEATLEMGLAAVDSVAWEELWQELRGRRRQGRRAAERTGTAARAFRLGLDFMFHPRNLVHCAYGEGDTLADPRQVWKEKPGHYA